jgi:hypothetical protein
MELTDRHIEAIREAVRTIEYGSVKINISASSRTIDLIVENRVKIEKESETPKVSKKA